MIAALRHRTGDKIQDRYEVLSELGSGAFGTAYKCRDLELNTYVAVKELHVLDDPQTAIDERAQALEQFRSEALHLSNLRHPHIVSGYYQPHTGTWLACPVCGLSFHGARQCPHDNAPLTVVRQRNYLVMEYLDGPDVGEATRTFNGTVPVPLAIRWVRQVAEALALIHSRGWIHRDVKPENIRLRLDGSGLENASAVLLDFGIASEAGATGEYSTRAQRHTQGGGTLGYAPDSPAERRNPDPRSDIHALGMTLYRLVSGRDPAEPDDLVALRQYAPRSFNSQLSPELENLILRSIAPDASQRPADGREWLRALDMAQGTDLAPLSHPSRNDLAPSAVAPTPITPLGFSSGRAATTPREAIALLDAHPGDAKRLLYSGQLAEWFDAVGAQDWGTRAREVQREFPDYREQGVEAMLQHTGLVAPPRCDAYPSYLEFGTLRKGEKRTVELRLHNKGRGWLFGSLEAALPGARTPRAFEGNDARVPITLDARRAGKGDHHGEIVVDTSAGELRVPVHAVVKGEDFAPTITVLLWSALGMLCGQLVRTVPLGHMTEGWRWLAASNVTFMPTGPLLGLMIWATLTLATVGVASARKSCATFFMGSSVALLCGVVSMFMGGDLLYTGDKVLQPLTGWLTRGWAPGGWMALGGALGAVYGTLQRGRDLVSHRISQVGAGWILSLALWMAVTLSLLALVPAFRQ